MTDLDPETYYDDCGESEWERLDANPVTRIEFESTTDYLERSLPDAGRVFDAGGAGRYAVWLAERGYDVTLLDVSAGQVAVAREKAADHGVADRVATLRGDLRHPPPRGRRLRRRLLAGRAVVPRRRRRRAPAGRR